MRDLDYYEDECYGCGWKSYPYEKRPCKKCIRYTETESDTDYHSEVKRETVKPSMEIIEKVFKDLMKMRDEKND